MYSIGGLGYYRTEASSYQFCYGGCFDGVRFLHRVEIFDIRLPLGFPAEQTLRIGHRRRRGNWNIVKGVEMQPARILF